MGKVQPQLNQVLLLSVYIAANMMSWKNTKSKCDEQQILVPKSTLIGKDGVGGKKGGKKESATELFHSLSIDLEHTFSSSFAWSF